MAAKASGARAAGGVGKIRRRQAGIREQIDQRHAEAGAGGEQCHAAVELHQREAAVGGAALERRHGGTLELRGQQGVPVAMAEAGIVVEHQLGIERGHLAVRGDGERIDLGELGVLGDEQPVELGREAGERTQGASAGAASSRN